MCVSGLDTIYVYIVYILGDETICLDCSRAQIICQQWFCLIRECTLRCVLVKRLARLACLLKYKNVRRQLSCRPCELVTV